MKNIRFVNVAIIFLLFLFQSCNIIVPTKQDIIGEWISEDGARLKFKENGTFEGENLPGDFFFTRNDEFSNKKFIGSGKWLLKEKQDWWEVFLSFDKISNRKKGYDTQILISGSSGLTEKNPPWYLFEWKGEKGGERYVFKKH